MKCKALTFRFMHICGTDLCQSTALITPEALNCFFSDESIDTHAEDNSSDDDNVIDYFKSTTPDQGERKRKKAKQTVSSKDEKKKRVSSVQMVYIID